MDNDSTPLKRCLKCDQVKPVDAFGSKRGKPVSRCKQCYAEVARSRYVPSTRVKLSDEELKRRKKECDKQYHQKTRDKNQAYHKEYYRLNSETIKRRVKLWAQDNPIRVALNNKKRKAHRRALEAAAEGSFTEADVKLQYRSQRGKCWWCGCELNGKYHADHLRPLNRGGTNYPNNIVASCATCNHSRKDRLPHEWSDRLL